MADIAVDSYQPYLADIPEATAKRIEETVKQNEELALKKRERAEAQDEEQRKRGRRMFGFITGTLQKFKTEQDEDVNKNRAELERKLQDRLEQESMELRAKMQQEKNERRIRVLQRKKENESKILAKIDEAWSNQRLFLAGFLETSSLPKLYYLPQTLTAEEASMIEKQKTQAQIEIESRKVKTEEQLEKWSQVLSEIEPKTPEEKTEDVIFEDVAFEDGENSQAEN